MARTYLTTEAGEIERWAAEYDAVPVREDDGFALVREGETSLDQERLRWDEFHAERESTLVVLDRRAEDPDRLAAVDREAYLDRMDPTPELRREILSRLGDDETVALSTDEEEEAEEPLEFAPETVTGTAEKSGALRSEPTDADVGKVVVTPDGDEVGIVTAVEDDGVHVDPHPGLTESALTTLGWSGVDDEDVRLSAGRIGRITTGTVRLTDDVDSEAFEGTTAGR